MKSVDSEKAFQDCYSDDVSHCYGCGRLNEAGLQLKSYWDGEETVAVFNPRSEHTAIPGYVYGGLIASLIDCHGTGTAAAVSARKEGFNPTGGESFPRFVTASLQVDYLKPTPIGVPLEIRAVVEEAKPRKVVSAISVLVNGILCAKGRVVAVKMPDDFTLPNR